MRFHKACFFSHTLPYENNKTYFLSLNEFNLLRIIISIVGRSDSQDEVEDDNNPAQKDSGEGRYSTQGKKSIYQKYALKILILIPELNK